jgi:glycosyltransferase involved in cell wall biosynthesis
MLKILVDVTPLREKPSGIGIYVSNLIKSLYHLQNGEDFQLGIYCQPSIKNWLVGNLPFPETFNQYEHLYKLPIPVNITSLLLLARFPNPILSYFDRYLNKPDIIHGTDHFVYPSKNSLRVMTIHDLTFIKYPNYVPSIVKTYAIRIRECLKWTDLVITFSQNSKQEIIQYLGVEPNRIFVTPQASRYSPENLSVQLNNQAIASLKYNLAQPYLLFVSTIEPRKNIINLIYAFNLLKQKYQIEHHLVLIGKKGWKYQKIFATIENSPWKSHIHHLDYLSDELVALFYAKADVFVYPSYYEGFGLPILEAMTLGTPVVTSNTSSIPEVAGDAALLIDPDDSTQLAEAILKVINDSQLRQELIHKGKERAKLFSWEKTARETLKAYRTLINPSC